MPQITKHIPAAIVYLGLGVAAAWYVLATGTAMYAALAEKSVRSYVTPANERVVRQSWPALSQNDVRRWLRPIVDVDGQVITTITTNGKGGSLVALVDNNYNDAIDAGDYVETAFNGTRYRFHGDGTVTTGGDKETKGDNRAITGKSKEILSKWSSFLSQYGSK